MAIVDIIDDVYVKANYPSLSTYNNADIISVIRMQQDTTLASDMTRDLYNDLIAKLEAGTTLDASYETLLEYAQKYLLALVVVGIFSFYETKGGEKAREYNISNLYGVVKYRQNALKNYIEATAFATIGDDFDANTYNYSPIYYPR